MKILLIRHGESENNVKAYQSEGSKPNSFEKIKSADPVLSEKGRLQAKIVSQYILSKKLKIAYILCSPLKRTVETAKIINSEIKTLIEVYRDLYEVGGVFIGSKIFPGQPQDWYKEQEVKINENEIKEDGWCFSNQIESFAEARIRAKLVLNEIKLRANSIKDDETLIIVGHGGIFHFLLSALVGQKEDSEKYFVHENCGITCLEILKDKLEIKYINNHEFLVDPNGKFDLTTDFKNLIKPYDLIVQIMKKINEKL